MVYQPITRTTRLRIKRATAGGLVSLLLASGTACATRPWSFGSNVRPVASGVHPVADSRTDWAAVEAIDRGTRIELELHEDAAPAGRMIRPDQAVTVAVSHAVGARSTD